MGWFYNSWVFIVIILYNLFFSGCQGGFISFRWVGSLAVTAGQLALRDFLTDCREWLTWLDELKWLLTFRLTGLFRAHCASFHIHSFPFFLASSSLSLIVLFQSCYSHAQVFGRTLVHEFHFFYSHTEWNLLFLKQPPLWYEATWDKPEASIKIETDEEEELALSAQMRWMSNVWAPLSYHCSYLGCICDPKHSDRFYIYAKWIEIAKYHYMNIDFNILFFLC